MNWKLTPGRIRCDQDSVLVVHDEPNFKVIEVDLSSKYPGAVEFEVYDSPGRDEVEFVVLPGEDTLRTDEATTRETTLLVTIDGADMRRWRFLCHASRYTWQIVMWKRDIAE